MISDCQFGKGQFHIMGRDDGGRVGRADWRMAMQCSNTVKGKSNLLNEWKIQPCKRSTNVKERKGIEEGK